MNEKLTTLFLDLKSKLDKTYQEITADETFMQERVRSLIDTSKKAMKAQKDADSSTSEEGRADLAKKFQKEAIDEQFEILNPLFIKTAPIRLESTKIMSTLDLEEFLELSIELAKEETYHTVDFTQKILERAQPTLIDELTDYEEELDDYEENPVNRPSTLRMVDPEELIN